jgi:hypothetical protein
MQDRHGMPIPMMVIGEQKAAAGSMVTAANGQVSGGAGQVSLAVASGTMARGASHTQSQMQPSDESLIDIGIPIPGVPQPVPPSMPQPSSVPNEQAAEQNLPSTGGIEASLNDVSVGSLPSDQISSRRVATQQQRGPQLVRRGEPMRISVESSSSEQGLLPAADDEGKIQVSFGDSPNSSGNPEISDGPGQSRDQVAHQDGIDPLSTAGAQSSAVDTVVTMNDSVMELSEMPAAQMEVPEAEAMQLPAISATGLATTSIPSQHSSRKRESNYDSNMPSPIAASRLPRRGYRGEPTPAPLQLSALSADSNGMVPAPEAFQATDQEFTKLSRIATGSDGQDEQPKQLDIDVDPSQLSIGTEIVVSREKPLVFNMDSPVVDYSVEHPGICRLIQTSDKSLSLIGLQEGDTRIAVVTAGGQEDRNIEIRGVRVAGGERPLSRLQNLAREITQTIKRLYPYSDIQVVASSDELIVQGYVQLEKDARKILTLVRKTSLTPVVDRLHSMSR